MALRCTPDLSKPSDTTKTIYKRTRCARSCVWYGWADDNVGPDNLAALHRSYKMMENDKVRYMEESKNIIKRQTQVPVSCWCLRFVRARSSLVCISLDDAYMKLVPNYRGWRRSKRVPFWICDCTQKY